MNSKIKIGIFIAGAFLALFFAFGLAQSVHAEDIVTPTPEVSPTESATPEPTESTPTETETQLPSETPTSDPTATPEPDGGELMMAMDSPMLMGAAVTKPVWFNTSVGIREYDTFSQAFADINLGLFPSDGIIHVEDFYAGAETDPVLSLYYATGKPYSSSSIKGIFGPSVDSATNTPVVIVSTPLEFMNFTGGFTISNICVDTTRTGDQYGAITLSNMSGTQNLKNLVVINHDSTSSGFVVETLNGSIVVTNVDSSGNAGGGAYLRTGTSGSITVTNSSFNQNNGVVTSDGTIVSGLVVETINSNSPVTLNGVSANGNTSNGSPGVLIKKGGALTVKNSMFNNNLGGGLANKQDPVTVTIKGATVLDNVTASDNYQSTPDVRGGSGIELTTNGSITANNIYATGNLNYGMKLDNCNFAGAACTSTAIGVVNITNSEFSSNIENSGLEITSRGAVTLKKVVANENPNSGAYGVKIDNTYGTAGVIITGTVAGDNQFNDNGTHGVQVDSMGNISLNFVLSQENTGDGAWLVNKEGKGTVTVSNSRIYHNISAGLNIESKNNVTILNVLSSENLGGSGVKIDNRVFTTGLGYGSVVVTNLSVIKNSDWGLDVLSNGTITGSGITANENPKGGAKIINQEATLPKNVSLRKSVFNINKYGSELGPGLVVLSKGTITLTGVGAYENGLEGIILENPSSLGAVGINNSLNPDLYSITGNGEEGVVITTKGAVSLTGVYADSNKSGTEINNYFFGRTAPVTISASHFNNNTVGDGLYVNSGGKILISKTSASGNTGLGAKLLNNQAASMIQLITINNDAVKIGTELNGFNDNKNGGLEIGARGPVTLINVEASGNQGNGGLINNFAGGPADLKITNSFFDFNLDDGIGGGYGLYVESMGNITLSGGSAGGNYLFGAHLDNQRGVASPIKNITISKFDFNDNETGFGLEAHSNGTLSVTSVKADENATYGAHLDNRLDDPLLKDSGMGMTVKTSSFSFNDGGIGLEIQTAGSVLIDGVTANGNISGEGLKVTSTPLPLSIKPVTINRSGANGNSLDGLKVDAVGLITLNGVTMNGNMRSGAVLDNSSMSIISGVTILSSLGANNFNNNIGDYGLNILTRGQVSLSLVAANNNLNGTGVSVDNCAGGAPGCGQANVSFSKITTRLNGGDGVLINTNALTVTMNGLVSLSNDTGSGIKITSNNSLAKISLLNSLFMGNGAYGIDVDRTGLNNPILTGTSYFGNETGNLYIH
jgi:hypothetical protein